jgi:hypothetical protein
MSYLNLRPSQVTLDPANPRLPDGTSSDREAINRLLEEGVEALASLARDIVRTGQTNPAEIPIAMKQGPKYLILEGNRRFAALKLLKDPTLADNEEHRKMFERAAAARGNPPKSIYTLIVANREEADPWIILRHTGENGGVGIKRWSAGQIATHRRRANRSIDSGTLRSIVIADSLEETYPADEELVELVRRVRREKLTNIGRFFSPEVLAALHFSIDVDKASSLDSRTLFVSHSAAQLRDFFLWAINFIQEHSVDAYKNAAVRHQVLLGAAHLIPSSADAAPAPFRLADGVLDYSDDPEGESITEDVPDEESDAEDGFTTNEDYPGPGAEAGDGSDPRSSTSSQAGQDSQPGRQRREARPEKYLLQNLRLPHHPERVQRILAECRSLDMEQSPGIACVMIRVLVELSLSSPEALSLAGSTESTSLRDKITRMLKFLDPNIEHATHRDKELAQAFIEASELGVQYLNGFVHNPNVRPDVHLARRFSSAFRPLLRRVDEAL